MGGSLSLLSNFFDQSFRIPTPSLTEKNLPDQDGKVFIITGANCGVGYNLTEILFSKHATVYLACRSRQKAEDAIKSISSRHPDSRGRLEFLEIDLSDLTSIKPAVKTFMSKESRLDWLDLNAGVSLPPVGSKGKQGHELQFSTNVLGPFLFTKLLLPVLQTTARNAPKGTVRVSFAASLVIEAQAPKGGIVFDAEGKPVDQGPKGQQNYAQTKVANFWLANEFAERSDAILFNSYNPGNLQTSLLRHVEAQFGRLPILFLNWTLLYESIFGAYTELYAGLGQDFTIAADQGSYVIPWGRKLARESLRRDLVEDTGPAKGSSKLWDWCEQETAVYYA